MSEVLIVERKVLGRNDPCRCGSGKKYKQCCLGKDEAAERESRAEAAAAAPAPTPETASSTAAAAPRHATRQPWKGTALNTRGFHKFSGPRKVGGGG